MNGSGIKSSHCEISAHHAAVHSFSWASVSRIWRMWLIRSRLKLRRTRLAKQRQTKRGFFFSYSFASAEAALFVVRHWEKLAILSTFGGDLGFDFNKKLMLRKYDMIFEINKHILPIFQVQNVLNIIIHYHSTIHYSAYAIPISWNHLMKWAKSCDFDNAIEKMLMLSPLYTIELY